MTSHNRILLFLAVLLLGLMYAAPLWRIRLEAPQYPEGLGLKIMLSDVQGFKEHDLSNINNLNHYIGMKRLEPDAIPELRIMPWAIGFLVMFGFAAAAAGKRWMLNAWVGAFTILAIAGLVDFYLWAYDYGHNLDMENAIIKVPGMVYQPPLIGSRKLLNFTAHSWPGLGGWAAFVSLGMGYLLILKEWKHGCRKAAIRTQLTWVKFAAMSALLAVGLGACTPEPEPFHFGEDQGAYCRMPVDDGRFASQIVLTTGRVVKFDSIECLAAYLREGLVKAEAVYSIWVPDFDHPETLLQVHDAAFVLDPSRVSSPMGRGLAAFPRTTGSVHIADSPVSMAAPLLWADVMALPQTHPSHF